MRTLAEDWLLHEPGANDFARVYFEHMDALADELQVRTRIYPKFAHLSDAELPGQRLAPREGSRQALLEAFENAFDASVHEGYGLTETAPTVSFNHVGEPIRPGTVGRPIWGVEVAIADPDVEDRIELLGADQLGEVVVRGHNLFKGYLGRPEATAEVVVDGWFRTGDLGTMTVDDVVTIGWDTADSILVSD